MSLISFLLAVPSLATSDLLSEAEVDFRRAGGRVDRWKWNDDRCPLSEPREGSRCKDLRYLECDYDRVCCPDHRRCVARRRAYCEQGERGLRWTTEDYGKRKFRKGKCHLVPAWQGGRRLDDVEEGDQTGEQLIAPDNVEETEKGEGSGMGVQDDVNDDSHELADDDDMDESGDEDNRRRMHVDRWENNPGACPNHIPRGELCGNGGHTGLVCNYNKVCCPDRRRCVAKVRAECKYHKNRHNTWVVKDYGKLVFAKKGKCHLEHN